MVKNGSDNCVQNNTHLHKALGRPILLKRCETGRPNWQTLLEQICQRRKVRSLEYHFRTREREVFIQTIKLGIITASFFYISNKKFSSKPFQGDLSLFYCGSPLAAKVIQPICDQLQICFSKEIF